MRQREQKKTIDFAGFVVPLVILAVLVIIAIIVAVSLPKSDPNPTEPATQQSTTETTTEEPTDTQAPTETQPVLDGWQELDGKRYYYENGVPASGWQTVDDKEYYFLTDGKMATGTVQIDGVNHFFSSTGTFFHVVNPWNYVPEGYEPDLKSVPTKYAVEGMRVDVSCYEDLMRMIDACNKAMNGKTEACVISSYRTMDDQTRAYNNKVDRVMAANPGMSREEAKIEAATVVAIPGTSEHQLGLAVDIIDEKLWALEEEQEDLPAQKWLMENCWRYGFLLRYPKGTTDSTGIIYEPWHYRYLGIELATEVHKSGMTVEQYLDSLS